MGGSACVGIALFLRLSWRRLGLTVGSLSVLADSVFPGAAHEALIKAFCLDPVNAHRRRLRLTCNINI